MQSSDASPSSAVVRIEMLGGLTVYHNDQQVQGLAPLASAVIAYLALNLHRTPSRDELLGQFWPDDDPVVGRHKLRHALHAIRRRLQEAGCDPDSILRATRINTGLDPKAVRTDVAEFEALLAAAKIATDPASRFNHLARAVSLYRGDLLPGCHQDALVAESNRLAAIHLDALHGLMSSYEASGDLDNAIDAARKVVAANPLVEEAHQDLMRLLAAKGQPSSVQRQYLALERLLDEELGIKPSDATRTLVESLRNRQKTVATERAPAALAQLTAPTFAPHASPRLLPNPRRYRWTLATIALTVVGVAGVGMLIGFDIRRGRPPSTSAPRASSASDMTSLPTLIPAQLNKELWVRRVANAPDEKQGGEPSAVTTDAANNIYVTGFVQTLNRDVDYLTVKFSPDGNLLWRATYNGPGNDVDRARFIAVDAAGNVYVTGDSDNGKGNGSTRLAGLDITTIKYAPDGKPSPTWPDVGFGVGVRRWNGPDDGQDQPVAMLLDESGAVYVLGSSWERHGKPPGGGFECALIKYDASGKQEWVARYNSGHGGDDPAGMVRDRFGYMCIAVTSRAEPPSGPEMDYVTLRYDMNGKLMWEKRYGEGDHSDDVAKAIGFDGGGNVYVIGEARGNPGTPDWDHKGIVTVSYDFAGRLRWTRGTLKEDDRIERLWGVHCDDGMTLLTGQATNWTGDVILRTVLRDRDGMPRWARDFGQYLNTWSVTAGSRTRVCFDLTRLDGTTEIAMLQYGDTIGEMDRNWVYRGHDLVGHVALGMDRKASPIVAFQDSDGPAKPRYITIMKYPP